MCFFSYISCSQILSDGITFKKYHILYIIYYTLLFFLLFIPLLLSKNAWDSKMLLIIVYKWCTLQFMSCQQIISYHMTIWEVQNANRAGQNYFVEEFNRKSLSNFGKSSKKYLIYIIYVYHSFFYSSC